MDSGEINGRTRFGAELRAQRTAKGWTQVGLGREIGYSGSYVSDVERGDRGVSEDFAIGALANFKMCHCHTWGNGPTGVEWAVMEGAGMASTLIELDERGRAALKAYGAQPGARYIAEVLPDGSIHLTPAVVVTAAEAAMWRTKPEVAAYLASDAFDGEEIDLDES